MRGLLVFEGTKMVQISNTKLGRDVFAANNKFNISYQNLPNLSKTIQTKLQNKSKVIWK